MVTVFISNNLRLRLRDLTEGVSTYIFMSVSPFRVRVGSDRVKLGHGTMSFIPGRSGPSNNRYVLDPAWGLEDSILDVKLF